MQLNIAWSCLNLAKNLPATNLLGGFWGILDDNRFFFILDDIVIANRILALDKALSIDYGSLFSELTKYLEDVFIESRLNLLTLDSFKHHKEKIKPIKNSHDQIIIDLDNLIVNQSKRLENSPKGTPIETITLITGDIIEFYCMDDIKAINYYTETIKSINTNIDVNELISIINTTQVLLSVSNFICKS